ncbi:hypothetical protein FBZ83_11994 [Azospirillum brasilense]|uniref:DUF7210 domain-containing protein n=1 Tax=Azospirillum brasilense TaxID=192 RepID=A0A560BV09_AZOBR|nr:hypothetical protein [Azospirillum brasilense]TWA76443.1 hypothetical protein FBZ83_11994 [Azospirillum brasilense]
MKILTLISVKHDKKLHAPGTELDVPPGLAKELIESGCAERVLVDPPPTADEAETGKPTPTKAKA